MLHKDSSWTKEEKRKKKVGVKSEKKYTKRKRNWKCLFIEHHHRMIFPLAAVSNFNNDPSYPLESILTLSIFNYTADRKVNWLAYLACLTSNPCAHTSSSLSHHTFLRGVELFWNVYDKLNKCIESSTAGVLSNFGTI